MTKDKFIVQPGNYRQMRKAIDYLCNLHHLSEDELLTIMNNNLYRFDMMNICSLGANIISRENDWEYDLDMPIEVFIKDFCQPWFDDLQRSAFTFRSKRTREGRNI